MMNPKIVLKFMIAPVKYYSLILITAINIV